MKILSSLLTPGGFLFVGPAEGFLTSCSGFTSINEVMSFAFRRAGAKTSLSLREPKRFVKRPVMRPPPSSTPDLATKPVPPPIDLSREDWETARRLADSGRLQEAAAWCDADLMKRGPSCETYYLLGLVHDAAGASERAGACYQKAIYLQPEHVEALTHLALIKEVQGDLGAAGRLQERARKAESAGRRVL